MCTYYKVLSSEETYFNQKGDRLIVVRSVSKKIKSEEAESEESTVVWIYLIFSVILSLSKI